MADLLIIVVLAVSVGTAIVYIVKEKKRGVKCIGCPAAGSCAGKCTVTGSLTAKSEDCLESKTKNII